ncbi:MAG: malectin domain-containing carbohydrate-binding protein [Phormidesmis sp.]
MLNGIEIIQISNDPNNEPPLPIVIPAPPSIHRAPPPPLIESVADPTAVVLYRINAGGDDLTATDGGPNWLSDTDSAALIDPGSNTTVLVPQVTPGATVPNYVPDAIFTTERYDERGGTNLQWAFATPTAGQYEVRLFAGNAYIGASQAGQRIFDVVVEGTIPTAFNNIDLSGQFGHSMGGMLSAVVEVTDGILNLEFLHDAVENPMINGLEIIHLNRHAAAASAVENLADNITREHNAIAINDELTSPDALIAPEEPMAPSAEYINSLTGGVGQSYMPPSGLSPFIATTHTLEYENSLDYGKAEGIVDTSSIGF